jgi:hypothetical protein
MRISGKSSRNSGPRFWRSGISQLNSEKYFFTAEPIMADFEKPGEFYLGRHYDLAQRKRADKPLLYDAKDLTTHAVCVGMTGSGKTGLASRCSKKPL